MELIRFTFPVKLNNYRAASLDWYISQYFGQNLWDKYKEWGLLGHNGIDIPCSTGSEVYAAHDGVVVRITESTECIPGNGKGMGIWLRKKEKESDGSYLVTIYWHLSEFLVDTNQEVQAGYLIGRSGSTGCSTGPHLHFGKKFVDDNNITLNSSNGYDGYVNPIAHFRMMQQPVIRFSPSVQDQFIPATKTGERELHIANEETLLTLMALGHLPGEVGEADKGKILTGDLTVTISRRK